MCRNLSLEEFSEIRRKHINPRNPNPKSYEDKFPEYYRDLYLKDWYHSASAHPLNNNAALLASLINAERLKLLQEALDV